MLHEGERLGEFEILGRLGQGAMGAVYKARQTVLKRLVAIKTLQPSLSSDAEFVTRFHNEAIAAAGLNHPNLVQVYAAGETQGTHWFAMEFVDGESVQGRLKRQGKLDPGEALAICMHVQTALAYGWRKAKLIHRDIKPDNIFLSNDGEVKLGDLGLAKSSDHQQSLTMTGASMGTPLYISPEQAEGKRDIDLRTDIYSLGATLYHLIAGSPPYMSESFISLMMKHVSSPVPDIRELNPALPQALSAVLMKCMQKAPEDRYGSYEELGDDLARAYAALSEPTIPAAAASQEPSAASAEASAPKNKRHPAVLISAITVPILAAGAMLLLGGRKKDSAPGAFQTAAHPAEKTAATPPVPASTGPKENAHPAPAADALRELVRKLEAKLLPVPGTAVLMSKTEVTVGEWKLYLRAEGLPPWAQPDPKKFLQTDEHPVVNIRWEQAAKFCAWLSKATGRQWNLPSNKEWEAAVGKRKYPWGEYYPPNWDDGNYAIGSNGLHQPFLGIDGIRGTAPVGSFKPNPNGFYDLGGNAFEWMSDKTSPDSVMLRGGDWNSHGVFCETSFRLTVQPDSPPPPNIAGFRVISAKNAEEKAAASPVTKAPSAAQSQK
jgi:serine/threonine-protein kinase